jgi:flagellar motor switch protein FliM
MQNGATCNIHASGLGPLELEQFRVLGTRFFDRLRRNLSRDSMVLLTLTHVQQGLETFGQFCEGARAQLVFVPVLESAATLIFRAGAPAPRLLVDALFNGSDEQLSGSEGAAEGRLSATESRILIQVLGAAFATTVEQIYAPLFGGGRVVDVIQNIDHASLLGNALASEEQMLTTEASLTLKGQSGDFALGLPLSMVSQLRTKAAPSSCDSNVTVGAVQDRVSIAAIPVEMSAVLAERELSLAEVRRLKPGSVIILQRLRYFPKAQLRAAGKVLSRGTIVENRGWHHFLVQQLESADGERAAE